MLEELKKEYNEKTFGRLKSENGNIVVYHGTSEKSANKILSDKFFKEGFFMGSKQPLPYGDSVFSYAKIRAKQANEKGNGVVLKMIVKPESLLINGAGELESIGDLYLVRGVWRNKKTTKEEISIEILEKLNPMSVSKILGISESLSRKFVITNIRFLYFQDSIRTFKELDEKIVEFANFFIELNNESPRKFSNRAKDFDTDILTFLSDLKKLKKINSKKLF